MACNVPGKEAGSVLSPEHHQAFHTPTPGSAVNEEEGGLLPIRVRKKGGLEPREVLSCYYSLAISHQHPLLTAAANRGELLLGPGPVPVPQSKAKKAELGAER